MNIDTDEFLPSKSLKNTKNKAGKKRTLSSTMDIDEEQQMQVDDASGIEGARKSTAVKTKRKKFTNAEVRKIPVPPHRFVSDPIIFTHTSHIT